MLTEKELADALIVNLENWDWQINTKFGIDETTGRALIEEYKALKDKNVHQMIDEVAQGICDNYCRYPHICDNEDDLMEHCNNCHLVTRF